MSALRPGLRLLDCDDLAKGCDPVLKRHCLLPVFASECLTGALLDRLTHHVHILEMNGDSYRLKQSKRRPRPNAQPNDTQDD